MQNKIVPRLIGSAITTGGVAYLIVIESEPCEGSLPEAVSALLLAPLVALVFSLPRPTWERYISAGFVAVLAWTIGSTWALTNRETSVQCESNPFIGLAIGWVVPAVALATGGLVVLLAGWLAKRIGRSRRKREGIT